jgi:hypothetical protein
MTATNVVIRDLMYILTKMSEDGTQLVDLDLVPDDNHPAMNKILLHPVTINKQLPPALSNEKPVKKIIVRNPNFSTENNDIFDSFNDLL